ncbi:hypothetical protein C8R43DRAFT_957815 [Mycena crocata]|nr:hypothetical protein C8R43DRAFT_957815 [Mycena crocata]
MLQWSARLRWHVRVDPRHQSLSVAPSLHMRQKSACRRRYEHIGGVWRRTPALAPCFDGGLVLRETWESRILRVCLDSIRRNDRCGRPSAHNMQPDAKFFTNGTTGAGGILLRLRRNQLVEEDGEKSLTWEILTLRANKRSGKQEIRKRRGRTWGELEEMSKLKVHKRQNVIARVVQVVCAVYIEENRKSRLDDTKKEILTKTEIAGWIAMLLAEHLCMSTPRRQERGGRERTGGPLQGAVGSTLETIAKDESREPEGDTMVMGGFAQSPATERTLPARHTSWWIMLCHNPSKLRFANGKLKSKFRSW